MIGAGLRRPSLRAIAALVVVALLALGVAGIAAAALAKNTVASAQIVNYSIKPVDLAANVINGSRCTWGPKTGQNYLFKPAFDPATNPGFFQGYIWCLVADRFEPNNTQAAPYNFLGGGGGTNTASIYPGGNHDWYVSARLAQYIGVEFGSGGFPSTIEVYKDGVKQTLNDGGPTSGHWYYNAGSAVSATWAVHVANAAPLTYYVRIG